MLDQSQLIDTIIRARMIIKMNILQNTSVMPSKNHTKVIFWLLFNFNGIAYSQLAIELLYLHVCNSMDLCVHLLLLYNCNVFSVCTLYWIDNFQLLHIALQLAIYLDNYTYVISLVLTYCCGHIGVAGIHTIMACTQYICCISNSHY